MIIYSNKIETDSFSSKCRMFYAKLNFNQTSTNHYSSLLANTVTSFYLRKQNKTKFDFKIKSTGYSCLDYHTSTVEVTVLNECLVMIL